MKQTLLIPSEGVLQACLPTAKTLLSLRPPSPPYRRGRLAPANQGAYTWLARGSRLSARSSHAFSSPWILTRHPHPTNQTSQGSQPHCHPRSPQLVTSPAGPARPAAALSLRRRWGEGAQQEPARVSPSARPNINKQASPNSPAAPSTSSFHPRAGGVKQTGLRSPAQRHIVRSCGSYLGLRARPGGGPSGAGAARGEEQRAAATRAGEGRGRLHAGRRPRSPRRRQRRGSPAGHGAVARRVLLLGRRRRLLQPSSQRRAAPGVRSTFSRSFPHAASERALLHTRAHPQTSRSLRKIKISGIRAKRVTEVKARQRCADLGVPSERRPREGRADAGGGRPTQFVRRSPSARGLRRPDRHPSRRPCGLGREAAAAPPHISGLPAEAERWPLPQERLKARTLARGSWEVHRRATPRTATEGRCPPNNPKEFSATFLSLGSSSSLRLQKKL
ncbi:uncharacterized protein LOC123954545 [Meles meles]|uniref:uncharacterized protein LOC123954545 n=1 Tax=Meles meles TaxID=9662 RepID=UPI001E69FBE9|nr:uncharacterized protein LOC123954545 [Meles meles]